MTEMLLANQMLLGANAVVCFVISLYFLRFWKKMHDRFFLFFALSFAIEGCDKIVTGLIPHSSSGDESEFCVIRLAAFLILLWAIIDKNWLRGKKSAEKKDAQQ